MDLPGLRDDFRRGIDLAEPRAGDRVGLRQRTGDDPRRGTRQGADVDVLVRLEHEVLVGPFLDHEGMCSSASCRMQSSSSRMKTLPVVELLRPAPAVYPIRRLSDPQSIARSRLRSFGRVSGCLADSPRLGAGVLSSPLALSTLSRSDPDSAGRKGRGAWTAFPARRLTTW